MVVSPFSVIRHPDGGCIDFGVESQLHIIPVLRGVVVINIRWYVVFIIFNLHGLLHLCSMDGHIRTIVVLPVVTHLIYGHDFWRLTQQWLLFLCLLSRSLYCWLDLFPTKADSVFPFSVWFFLFVILTRRGDVKSGGMYHHWDISFRPPLSW